MFNCDIKTLKEFSEENHYADDRIDGWSTTDIENNFDLQSTDFLDFAQIDLRMDDVHHLINCLSNVKRAIECQIDSILIGLGLFEKSTKEKWNFPKKIEVLNELGIISPRILIKINKIRNLLEHQYSKPDKEKVEDAVDIAILFFRSTEKYLINFPIYGVLWDEEGKCSLDLKFDYKKSKFIFIGSEFSINQETKIPQTEKNFTIEIDAKLPEYFEYLKIFLRLIDIERKRENRSIDE
jgi:uncharacterized protein YutE (UPF0331/DUF86 family)